MGVGETVLSVLFTEIKRIGIRFRAVYETIGLALDSRFRGFIQRFLNEFRVVPLRVV
jgi:hypothetical protein